METGKKMTNGESFNGNMWHPGVFEFTVQDMYLCLTFVNAANYRNFLKDNFNNVIKWEKIIAIFFFIRVIVGFPSQWYFLKISGKCILEP